MSLLVVQGGHGEPVMTPLAFVLSLYAVASPDLAPPQRHLAIRAVRRSAVALLRVRTPRCLLRRRVLESTKRLRLIHLTLPKNKQKPAYPQSAIAIPETCRVRSKSPRNLFMIRIKSPPHQPQNYTYCRSLGQALHLLTVVDLIILDDQFRSIAATGNCLGYRIMQLMPDLHKIPE